MALPHHWGVEWGRLTSHVLRLLGAVGGLLPAHLASLPLEVVSRDDDVYQDRRDAHRRQESNQERPKSQ